MRFSASQGSGATCAVVGALSLVAGLQSGPARKSRLEAGATSDGGVLRWSSHTHRVTGPQSLENYNAATIFRASPAAIGLMICRSETLDREPPIAKSSPSFRRLRVSAGGDFYLCSICSGGLVKPQHGLLHRRVLQHTQAPSLEGACGLHSGRKLRSWHGGNHGLLDVLLPESG
jgi:hypothetical protein